METYSNPEIIKSKLETMYTEHLRQLVDIFHDITELIDFNALTKLFSVVFLASEDKRCNLSQRFFSLVECTTRNYINLWKIINHHDVLIIHDIVVNSINKEQRAELLVDVFRCRKANKWFSLSKNISTEDVVSKLTEYKNKCEKTKNDYDKALKSVLPFKITPELQKQFDKFENLNRHIRKPLCEMIDSLLDLSRQCVDVDCEQLIEEYVLAENNYPSGLVELTQSKTVYVNPHTC